MIKVTREILENVEVTSSRILAIQSEDIEKFPFHNKNLNVYFHHGEKTDVNDFEYLVAIRNENRNSHGMVSIFLSGDDEIYDMGELFDCSELFNESSKIEVEDREEFYLKLGQMIIDSRGV